MSEQWSQCCLSSFRVHHGGEGTNHYVCNACNGPCDVTPSQTSVIGMVATDSEATDGSSNPPTQALINKAVIKELEQLDPYERCDTFCDIQCDHAGKVIQERLKELRGAA